VSTYIHLFPFCHRSGREGRVLVHLGVSRTYLLCAEEGRQTNTQLNGEEENMAEKVEIPWETKYKFAVGGYHAAIKGILTLTRENYGAEAALERYERFCKIDDRVKNVTNTIRTVFKIEGNDAETIGKWWDIFGEITGMETTIIERNKTIDRRKTTKCPWKTEPKDISDWFLIGANIIIKTINPKATVERPKAMCAGDSHCEYVYKIEG